MMEASEQRTRQQRLPIGVVPSAVNHTVCAISYSSHPPSTLNQTDLPLAEECEAIPSAGLPRRRSKAKYTCSSTPLLNLKKIKKEKN